MRAGASNHGVFAALENSLILPNISTSQPANFIRSKSEPLLDADLGSRSNAD